MGIRAGHRKRFRDGWGCWGWRGGGVGVGVGGGGKSVCVRVSPYVLDMVKAQRRSFSGVLQGLSGEGLVMTIQETEGRTV